MFKNIFDHKSGTHRRTRAESVLSGLKIGESVGAGWAR